MWNQEIESTVDRALSGIIYDIWGVVGFSTKYLENDNKFHLIVWDKSYKCVEKKEVVNKLFDFKLDGKSDFQIKHDLIAEIEMYLIENFT